MDSAAGPLARARHDLARGRPDSALAALEHVTGPELERTDFWRLRAHALYQLRDWDDAAQAARAGLERNGEDFELLDVLALSHLECGRKKEALATVDVALRLYPDSAELHAHRALILARSAHKSFRFASFKKARAALDDALRLDPHSETALRVRAQIATMSGDRRAGEYSAELLSLDPEDDQAHVIAGAALARRGDIGSGLEHYVEAARLDPSDPRRAWMGRRSRALQGRFAAPLVFAASLSRGHFRIVWVLVVLASLHAHQPLLTAAILIFWAYTWAVQIYLRIRVGKAPK